MWFVDFRNLFDNYENYQSWEEEDSLAALVFVDAHTKQLVHTLFASFDCLDDMLDLVRFIECSFPSNVKFMGVLSLTDVEYPFDINSLNIFEEDPDDFIHIVTSKRVLESRDSQELIASNEELDLRQAADRRFGACIVRTSLQLNLSIKCGDAKRFTDEVSKVFTSELESIDKLYFVNERGDVILPAADGTREKTCASLLSDSRLTSSRMNFIDLVSLMPVTVNQMDDGNSRLVPIVKIRKGLEDVFFMKTPLYAVTVLYATEKLEVVDVRLRTALRRALYLLERCICEFSSVKALVQSSTNFYSLNDNLLMVQYPLTDDQSFLRTYRMKLHKIFNLPTSIPLLKPTQVVKFAPSQLLESPHLHIRNYAPKGEVTLVSGTYTYHHYMQDGIDDNGWGCAYRSFQTIWSWFVHQGFIDKPIPTHREIQESLYNCGDKSKEFVGSRQWIGSVELGYCLMNMVGIDSRMLTTNSGEEVVEKVRQLALHFSKYGTPVMIGGGMLAHTILGVDFNEETGQCSFLVLDPHYTGPEDIQTVVSKGFCAWKPPSFWKKEHFYNLLLPIPPPNAI